MSKHHHSRATSLLTFVVISLAIVGYFVGLQSPMHIVNQHEHLTIPHIETQPLETHLKGELNDVVPATSYTKMSRTSEHYQMTRLADLKPALHPLVDLHISPEEKQIALASRARNRAFNGAPPTIPHPIAQRSDAACVACHGKGVKTTSLRIPRMSHLFLKNCTQCHVEHNPTHMTASLFRENSFEGLPAPQSGPRAFAIAPPQIPHTTWMRSNCMSCHGETGLHGLRTTHPWRQNCQQCHAPSSQLDQILLVTEPQFLPGPNLNTEN